MHPTQEQTENIELTPPHPKRRESSRYKKSHEYLIHVQDTPCQACGVRQSTLGDPTQNKYGATQLETHHFPIEWSLSHACDPDKVHKKYPQVTDQETLEQFIDSSNNLLVICDICHRSKHRGIHHLLPQDWFILPFLRDDYIIVTNREKEKEAIAHDEEVLHE